jgi:predicted metal-dependent phosphoesterase TrpH
MDWTDRLNCVVTARYCKSGKHGLKVELLKAIQKMTARLEAKMDINQAETDINIKEMKEEIKSGQAEIKSTVSVIKEELEAAFTP